MTTQTIQIFKNNRMIEEISLEEGSHTFGRGPSNEIVLSDASISKTHGTLVVGPDSISVQDNNSSNGIYHSGQRISEKQFTQPFSVELGPFSLKGLSEDPSQTTATFRDEPGLFSRLVIHNIKTSIFILVSILMVCTVVVVHHPLKNEVVTIQKRDFLKTGILLARYLGELNRPFLETQDYKMIRLNPVNQESGVIYAVILDAHGRIISPREQQGDFFKWDGLAAAYQKETLSMGVGEQKEKIIFYPIANETSMIGAAVIGYAYEQMAKKHVSSLGATIYMILIFLFIVAFFLSFSLSKVLLNPIKSLHEDAEMAIKEGRTNLAGTGSFNEIEDLRQTIERLLMRHTAAPLSSTAPPVSNEYTPAPPPERTESPVPPAENIHIEQPSPEQKQPEETHGVHSNESMQTQIQGPWLMIDSNSFMIAQLSDNFDSTLGFENTQKGVHVIEAFDAEVIQAVSELMDGQEGDSASVNLNQKHFTLRRVQKAGDTNNILIVFEADN
jgi:hypothetical protein